MGFGVRAFKFSDLSLFLLASIFMLSMFLLVGHGYNINLSLTVHLVDEISSYMSSDEGALNAFNPLGFQIVPYAIAGVMTVFFDATLVVKFLVVLSLVASSFLLLCMLHVKGRGWGLSYFLVPALFGYQFLYFDFSIIVGLPIFLGLVFVLCRTCGYSEKAYLSMLALSVLLVFTSPHLYFSYIFFLVFRVVTAKIELNKIGVIVSLTIPSLVWFCNQTSGLFLLSQLSFYDIELKTMGHDIVGLVSWYFIHEGFSVTRILIPVCYLFTPFVLGYALSKNLTYWALFIISIIVFLLEPLFIPGAGFFGYGLLCLPILAYPFLWEKRNSVRFYRKVVVGIFLFTLPISYADKSIDFDVKIARLADFGGTSLDGKSVWYDSVDSGFQGVFNENAYLGSSIIHYQNANIGYSFLDRVSSPLIKTVGRTQYDPYKFRGKWKDRQHMQKFDHLLLYNCSDVKTDLVPYTFIRSSGCWQLFRVE